MYREGSAMSLVGCLASNIKVGDEEEFSLKDVIGMTAASFRACLSRYATDYDRKFKTRYCSYSGLMFVRRIS